MKYLHLKRLSNYRLNVLDLFCFVTWRSFLWCYFIACLLLRVSVWNNAFVCLEIYLNCAIAEWSQSETSFTLWNTACNHKCFASQRGLITLSVRCSQMHWFTSTLPSVALCSPDRFLLQVMDYCLLVG